MQADPTFGVYNQTGTGGDPLVDDIETIEAENARLKSELAAAQAGNTDAAVKASAAEASGTGSALAATVPAGAATQTGISAALPTGTDPEPVSLLDQVKDYAGEFETDFLGALRGVTSKLEGDGKIVESDVLAPTEASRVTSVLVKLVGELVEKV